MVHDHRLLLAAACVIPLCLLSAALPAQAAATPAGGQAPALIISEVGWAGSSANQADEWFELTNLSDDPVPLAGWTIDGALSGGKTLTLPNASLAPHAAYLIANFALGDAESTLARAPDLVTSAVSLSNSNLGLALKRPDGSVADEAGNGKSPLAGHVPNPGAASMVRVSPVAGGTTKAAWTDATQQEGFASGAPDLGTPGFVEGWVGPATIPAAAPEADAAAKANADPSAPTDASAATIASTGTGSSKAPDATNEPQADDGVSTTDQTDANVTMTEDTTSTDAANGLPGDDGAAAADAAAQVEAASLSSVADGANDAAAAAGDSNASENAPTAAADATSDAAAAQTSAQAADAGQKAAAQTAVPIVYPPGTLAINEFASDPGAGANEWVEIANPFNTVIPLNGWRLQNARGLMVDLPDQLIGFGQFAVAQIKPGFLPNASGKILLEDPSGATIDWIAYGSGSVPSPKHGESAALSADGAWAVTTTPTPGEANAITPRAKTAKTSTPDFAAETAAPSPTAASSESPSAAPVQMAGRIALSELYPNAAGDDLQEEFIEVKNDGDKPADVKGWTLRDQHGISFTQPTSLTLAAGETVALPRPVTHLVLGNEHGAVTLVDPTGLVADYTTYGKAPRGQAYAKVGGVWVWTEPTPDEPNVPPLSPAPAPTKSVTKKTQKTPSSRTVSAAPTRKPVHVQGIVTSRSGSRVRVETASGARTIVLPGGTDTGVLGIRSGRAIDAIGTLMAKSGSTVLTVASTADVRTEDPVLPGAPPTGASSDSSAQRGLRARLGRFLSETGRVLRTFFGHS